MQSHLTIEHSYFHEKKKQNWSLPSVKTWVTRITQERFGNIKVSEFTKQTHLREASQKSVAECQLLLLFLYKYLGKYLRPNSNLTPE